MSNELQVAVEEELLWEPRVNGGEISVSSSAVDNVVTLRGTVGSLREKLEAAIAAKRVRGVKFVHNDIEVAIPDEDRRADGDLRGAVVQALMLNDFVPSSVAATAHDGIVTLTGTATFQFQRDEAEFVAGNVYGVAWVNNDIELTSGSPTADDMTYTIKKALERSATVDADRLSVASADGRVTLAGIVGSWSEHDAAVSAAWSATGVRTVADRLVVVY